MLNKPVVKAGTLAVAVTAALTFGGGMALAQSGSAGAGDGSGMDSSARTSGATVPPAPSGASDTSGRTNGSETSGTTDMPGSYSGSSSGMTSSRGVDPGVYPLIGNDSLYPDPKAGMPTGVKRRWKTQ